MRDKKEVEKEEDVDVEEKLISLLVGKLVKFFKGKLAVYIVAVVFGLGGGTSPLWYGNIFAREPGSQVDGGAVNEPKVDHGKELAKKESEIENLQRKLDEALADVRRERERTRSCWQSKRKDGRSTGVSERNQETAGTRREDSRSGTE